MGVQYHANKEDINKYGKWSIWDNAKWNILSEKSSPLEAGKWYHIIFEFMLNVEEKRYLKFQVIDEDEVYIINLGEDNLKNYVIIDEKRDWGEKVLWITLESENQWSNDCEKEDPSKYVYRVNYDNVKLSSFPVLETMQPNITPILLLILSD